MNLYAYVGGDPVNWVDSTGLIAGVDDAVVIGGGAVLAAWLSTPQGQQALADAAGAAKKVYYFCKNDFLIKVTFLKAATKIFMEETGEKCTGDECQDDITKEEKVRNEPGGDGATSKHIVEKQGDDTISVTHQVEDPDGNVIHQHQTHIGKEGTKKQFPNEWVEYPDR